MSDRARPAPFSAMLYCFSTLDMLAALAGGEAGAGASTTTQAKGYLQKYLRYSERQVNLLQGLFRHKLVHLAQPKAIVKCENMFVSWEVLHEANEEHCRLISLPEERRVEYGPAFGPKWACRCTHLFRVSVDQFVMDIANSSDRYIEDLHGNSGLEEKTRRALKAIYEP